MEDNLAKFSWTRAQFHKACKNKNLLSMNFFLGKNMITNQISMCCIFLATCIQLLLVYPENHDEIWLVILFLSRTKFHAKEVFVLTDY